MRFFDRRDAGRQLGELLSKKYHGKNVVICALPRGGVVVGVEIAKMLKAPLELVIPRKIGHPMSPEYAIAAVTEHGEIVAHREEVSNVDKKWLEGAVQREIEEARRRRTLYLGKRISISLEGKIAIIVDDGIATGLTMQAAIRDIKNKKPAKIIVAVPVAPQETVGELQKEVDGVVVLDAPEDYAGAVGAYYRDFPQIEDDEVITLLKQQQQSR